MCEFRTVMFNFVQNLVSSISQFRIYVALLILVKHRGYVQISNSEFEWELLVGFRLLLYQRVGICVCGFFFSSLQGVFVDGIVDCNLYDVFFL